jgi:two-component system, sensor histidine kinase and response regulator
LRVMERASEGGSSFPLILIDGHMPGMSGFELAMRIRENPHLAGSTVMMLTSAEQGADISRCDELGISAYLIKPIRGSDLLISILHALRRTDDSKISSPPITAVPSRANNRRGLSLLMAEDNAVNQRLAIHLLEKAGHQVHLAQNGKEAVTKFRERRFDLVFMDVQMPEMDGFDATGAIRQLEQTTGSHVPIIALTAHAMKGDLERCLRAGMDGYITKPIKREEILRVIGQYASIPGEGFQTNRGLPAAERVLNREELIGLVGGDTTALADMIDLFQHEAQATVIELDEMVGNNDCRGVERTAHKLKGCLCVFGAAAASATAADLEKLGQGHSLETASAVCGRLKNQISRLEQELGEVKQELCQPKS